eukprot:1419741-Prymnesium_polylepis.2
MVDRLFAVLIACAVSCAHALRVCGLEVPSAKLSPASRALDDVNWPDAFPYTKADLTPMMDGNDGLFYVIPKFVQHAGGECRASLTEFYKTILCASELPFRVRARRSPFSATPLCFSFATPVVLIVPTAGPARTATCSTSVHRGRPTIPKGGRAGALSPSASTRSSSPPTRARPSGHGRISTRIPSCPVRARRVPRAPLCGPVACAVWRRRLTPVECSVRACTWCAPPGIDPRGALARACAQSTMRAST